MRDIQPYNPYAAASIDWPDWTFQAADLGGLGEVFDLEANLVRYDPAGAGDFAARTHVLAHLDLGHHLRCGSGRFSDRQEDHADAITDVLMMRDLSDMPTEDRLRAIR